MTAVDGSRAPDEAGQHLLIEVGKAVRHLRTEAGLSQQAVAGSMGSTQALISYAENGKADLHLTTLRRIAEALGYDIEVRFTPSGWDEAFEEALTDIFRRPETPELSQP